MGKYFKYAIGEIFLVVIGILIALQINNWNENRKDREEERILLTQLKSEFESNLKQLDEKISIREKMINSSFKLLEYYDNPALRNNDSINKYLVFTTLAPTFDPIVNDINSSGKIHFLSNTRLKELLSLWTSEIVAVTEEEVVWDEYRTYIYRPFLIEFSAFRNILKNFWENNTTTSFHLDKGTKVKFNIKDSKVNKNATKVFENSHIEDHLAFCATISKVANTQSKSLRKRIVEILQIIEIQLKESE